MIRFWIGLWLLAASWLFGAEYFFRGSAAVWITLVVFGVAAISWSQFGVRPQDDETVPPRSTNWLNLLVVGAMVPVAVLAPWPYRVAPLLLGSGALLALVPGAGRWLHAASTGATTSGLILFAQTLALWAYKYGTARSHELPWPLPQLLAGVMRLFGVNAGTDGADLILPTMRENHRLGATWELLLDPATLCFLVGGIAAIALASRSSRREEALTSSAANTGKDQSLLTSAATKSRNVRESAPVPVVKRRWPTFGPGSKAIAFVLLAVLLWQPLRVGLSAAVLLHRALRTDYEASLNLMGQFWSPWTHLLLLLPLALLAALWTRRLAIPTVSFFPVPARRPFLLASGSACAAAVVLTLAVLWDPIGVRKSGRVAVDEFHSKWEQTGRPMDTEWYGHLSGYNYASLYDYCSRLYEMSRLTNSLTDAALAGLDVLIVKVPTERYAAEEIDVIERFVGRGGGLLLIGEHTDVFNTSLHLNSIARRFGFSYRHDCLFGARSFFDQYYEPPAAPHPVLRYVRDFDFATSCSIDPGISRGRGVIVSAGLKNSMADYHANNYYPQAVDHAAMRYGAFAQLWSVRQGRGRVLAFTDSTIFSSFSTFEPGKIELFTGMIEWLNRQDRIGNPRPLLLVLGLALAGWSVWLGLRTPGGVRLAMVAAGALGWTVTSLALVAHQRAALPEPQPLRPWTWVTIDRTVCDTPLSKGGFIAGKPDGFGIFERWILRLGYFIKRESGLEALRRDATVFFQPTKAVTPEFRAALVGYVENGGRILVIDSPKNEKSTAAALLEPFGLSQKALPGQGGTLSGPAGWPAVPVEAANEITGGRPLFRLDGKSVGAVTRRGKGTLTVIGFGSRFADMNMGTTGDVEPDAALRKVFDLQFALVRALMQDQLESLAFPQN